MPKYWKSAIHRWAMKSVIQNDSSFFQAKFSDARGYVISTDCLVIKNMWHISLNICRLNSKEEKQALVGRAPVYMSEKREYWEGAHFTSLYRITHHMRGGENKTWARMSEGGACRTSLSVFLPMLDGCKACSISRRRPVLQAVCQKERGSLEWGREVTLEREHLSLGN